MPKGLHGQIATYVVICRECGKWMPTYASHWNTGGHFCSTKCYGLSMRGNGEGKDYPCLYVSGSYKAGRQKKIREHRAVMEAHLGRKLDPKEHVHHINGNRKDNRIENLEIMNPSDHGRKHLTFERASSMGHISWERHHRQPPPPKRATL